MTNPAPLTTACDCDDGVRETEPFGRPWARGPRVACADCDGTGTRIVACCHCDDPATTTVAGDPHCAGCAAITVEAAVAEAA